MDTPKEGATDGRGTVTGPLEDMADLRKMLNLPTTYTAKGKANGKSQAQESTSYGAAKKKEILNTLTLVKQ